MNPEWYLQLKLDLNKAIWCNSPERITLGEAEAAACAAWNLIMDAAHKSAQPASDPEPQPTPATSSLVPEDCWDCEHLEKRSGGFQYCLLNGGRRNIDANHDRCVYYKREPQPTPVAGNGSLREILQGLIDQNQYGTEAPHVILAVADWMQENYTDPNWEEASKWADWFAKRLRGEVEE